MRGKQSTTQAVVCTVCGQDTTTTHHANVQSVYSAKAYDVMRCANCQHFFTWPAPTTPELDDIYNNRYSYDAHSLIEREKVMRAKNYARFIASMPDVSSAMEVGCMHGLLLTELEKHNIKASGVELDPQAVEHCRQKGLDVVQSSIEEHLQQAGNRHDVIIMSHVIEHIAKPQEQLASLHERMSKNGRLVLITPNSMAKSRRAFGKFWGYWQVPVHINHFNESSMRHLLEKSGFKLLETRYYGGDSLFFLSSLANIMGVSNNSQQLSGIKKIFVRAASLVLKPWYHSGKEDMLIVAQKI
jgi:SAM-dependent methyltransferase